MYAYMTKKQQILIQSSSDGQLSGRSPLNRTKTLSAAAYVICKLSVQ